MQTLINKILVQIAYLRRKLIYSKSLDYLGRDFTPNDIVPDEYGCAEAVTTLLKQIGCVDRVITGTWTLYDYLNKSRSWVNVMTPEQGDIILSPTGESRYGRKAPIIGHVGIVGKDGLIFSNDSYTGKWSTHYSLETWKKRYGDKGGYPILIFRYISLF